MERRAFILDTVATLAAPLAAEPQQPQKLYRIGILAWIMREG
jgi:hypothetical protein